MEIEYALLLCRSGRVHRSHQTSDGFSGTLVEGVGAMAGDVLGGDRIEGDILDAITEGGRCATCGTPWASVVKIEGNRPVKIEGGCPNEVCVQGDW